ncbi:MAG: sortase [Patescibacteria group bacterium]|mgnify:CR=1 FL=1
MYGYIKKPAKKKIVISRRVTRTFSALFFFTGLFLIGSVIFPFLQWQFFQLPRQPQNNIVSPIPQFVSPVVLASENINSWVPVASVSTSPGVKFYTLSIPKLRIENATVEFGATDLKKSLIGWADSALPGSFGTNIIFGHSALPQFYNPKNYTTIFSLLPTLAIGDPIYVNYDGVSYKYKVVEMRTVDPEDYSILEQRFDDSYISLITCVPPGTYWKRLVVRAKITKF